MENTSLTREGGAQEGRAMRTGRSLWIRVLLAGLGCGVVLLTSGDHVAQTATIGGIDPIEILKVQIKNNVLFVFDTSASMFWTPSNEGISVGGDDPMSRMYQAKQAVKAVVEANRTRLNMGIATYNVPPEDATLNARFGGWTSNTSTRNGPLVYVSDDPEAAHFYPSFFNNASDTYSNYSGDPFRSFENTSGFKSAFIDPATGQARYYMNSKLYRNNVRYTWNTSTKALISSDVIDCAVDDLTPPADGFLGNSVSDPNMLCFQMQWGSGGDIATFYFTSLMWNGNANCGGAAQITNVVPCGDDVALDAAIDEILGYMEPSETLATIAAELPKSADLQGGFHFPTVNGFRATQYTPIADSFYDIRSGTPSYFFPPRPAAVQGLQKNYVILLTDGDDTCDNSAAAATQAGLLYNSGNPSPNPTGEGQAEVMVVAFTTSAANANAIARSGSGNARDAFTATTLEELIRSLQSALELTLTSGEFSTAGSVLASVFELGPMVNDPACVPWGDPNPGSDPICADPLEPNTRYNNRVNVLYQPTWDLPNFDGHLFAYLNDGSFQPVGNASYTGRWEAGETMERNVEQYLENYDANTGNGPDQLTYSQLYGTATVRNLDPAAVDPPLKRRIFTSSPVAGTGTSTVNRSYPRSTGLAASEWDASLATGSNVVALWPPNQTGLTNGLTQDDIDPPNDPWPNGVLDDDLGIGSLTYAELRNEFKSCHSSTASASGAGAAGVPDACNDAAKQTAYARKEARQTLLAWIAGAGLAVGGDSLPLRDATSRELLYRDRGWLLLDSTLATPAVVGPPQQGAPPEHVREFLLYRDGRRDGTRQGVNEIDSGFGLRNPDFDDTSVTTKLDLKPVMTVVYLATNGMLHAFRAGPNCGAADPASCAEPGSEELWAFLPLDQLAKPRELRHYGQQQDPHTYTLSSSVRVADIFVPTGRFSLNNVDFDGRWRTVLFFGRGPGGKFYTALDVTAPGPFTREALLTNPPWVMWNHGNEDGVVDPYDGMGQTWSVPAVDRTGWVDANNDGTPEEPEYRMWVGSGYGDLPDEGSTFYMLDAVNGDVLYAIDVGDGTATYFPENALVASPATFNYFHAVPHFLFTPDPSTDKADRVYIPDIHGRLWKFDTVSGAVIASPGPSQPLGSAPAVFARNTTGPWLPHVYVEAGNDLRVPESTTFKAFAYRDGADANDVENASPTPATLLFVQDLVDTTGNKYRGTLQPALAVNAAGDGRVFYAGTRYVAAGADCISRFDTVLFGLKAVNGGPAYDFGSAVITGQKATILYVGPQPVLGESGGLGDPPGPPDPPPNPPTPSRAEPPDVNTMALRPSSPVCRQ